MQQVNIPASLVYIHILLCPQQFCEGVAYPIPNTHPLVVVKSTPATRVNSIKWLQTLTQQEASWKWKEESFKLAVVKQMEGSTGCIWHLSVYFLAFVVFCHCPIILFPLILCKRPCLFAFLITCRVNYSFTRENAAGRIRKRKSFWLEYFQHGIKVACDFEQCKPFVCLAFFPCFSQSSSISQAADTERESAKTLSTFSYLQLNLHFHT